MGLDKILAISGKPGLYELKTQTIYTFTEEVPLREIFKKIQEKENGEPAISHKESKGKLEAYFSEVLPDYDEDRVYVSDMKKVIQWYNILQSKGLTDFSETEATNTSEEEE